MKFRNVVSMLALSAAGLMVAGCDVKKNAEDLGFKQGNDMVEKGVIKYDTLVDKDEDCNRAWANYESNLTRRAQMVPQLVSIVKASAAHEEVTLVAIAQAR